MDRRRSPLDTINSGRRRRPSTSLDDLDRMLARMEGREPPRPSTERLGMRIDEPRREREPSDGWSRAALEREPRRTDTLSDRLESLQGATREYERARQQEDSLSNVSRIAAELKAIREEFRSQIGSGVHREFDEVRRDLQRLTQSVQSGSPKDVTPELERLADAVRSLSERSDDRSINVLRLELEQVRKSLDHVAREDTIHSVNSRWDDFGEKFAALEDRIGRNTAEPELKALGHQVENIATMLAGMPDSSAIRSLEDKVRVLAASVDHIAANQAGMSPQAFAALEDRLDEISRAIVASAVSVQPTGFDPAPLERIEARMTALAQQMDELAEDRAGSALVDHITHLSSRVDEMARRIELPETMVERLADQMALIMEKLDRESPAPDLDLVFHNLESRFDHLSTLLERRQEDAMEQGQLLFRELERRLEHVAQRLDNQPAPAKPDTEGMMRAIDARFADLAKSLDRRVADRDSAPIKALETRLEAIARQIESSARTPGIDLSVVAGLERQLTEMSDQLARPAQFTAEGDDIGLRLDHIERAIEGNREAILEAARKVAVDAARTVAASDADPQTLDALTADLRALDTLTRRSDERNAKTFEAIHDTLLKIVDRLGTLEETRGARGFMPMRETPPLDLAERDVEAEEEASPAMRLTPSQAASAAAVHALRDESPDQESSGGPRSMLSGLTRAFTARKDRVETNERSEPALTEDTTAPDLDEPLDPAIVNRPLEPGSGAPDLSAIMKRVRDERGQSGGQAGLDAAKSDFIAAARRAAQAAAAEAEVVKKGGDPAAKSSKLKLGEMFRSKRKTMLLAATGVMVVLAGLQLSNAFFADAPQAQQAETDIPAPIPGRVVGATDVAQADTPEKEAAGEFASTESEEDMDAIASSATPDFVASASALPDSPPPAPTGKHIDLYQKLEDPTPAALTPAPAAAAPASMPAQTASLPASEVKQAPAEVGPEALRQAADEGDPKAMFEVASRYAEGRGTKVDPVAASEWFRRSAELGYAPSQYRMGNLYEKGVGVERNAATAKEWYEKAAAQGNGSAMHNLAVLLAMGTDGPADNQGAVRWFREAADLGIRDSQFNLAILAAKGAGMPQDLEESYRWFSLVADSGDRDAASKRDEVAKAMRPEQLEKAKATAKLWTPKKPDETANVVDIPDEWTEDSARAETVDMRQAVLNIQTILNKNGYDAGPADGMMGGKTKNAIVAFQKDNGMAASGEVTEDLVKALLERR